MAVSKGCSKSAAARRKRKTDPTNPRSIAARSRNKDPCEGCKNSRQACSGGPPNVCSRCETKGIVCKPGSRPAETLRIN
ncbi:uncharacterized protein FOMMEDRAFT_138210, partial [Fomitiporia mediterranea MF3/22]|uniref:uncharacterized protein n=1 Tax=Fomitiporia mediterranea (strain MF3/22) TaxID=694068 RepID=UPI000440760E